MPGVYDDDFDLDDFSEVESPRRPRPLVTAVSVVIVIGQLAVPVWVLWTAVRG